MLYSDAQKYVRAVCFKVQVNEKTGSFKVSSKTIFTDHFHHRLGVILSKHTRNNGGLGFLALKIYFMAAWQYWLSIEILVNLL